MIDYLLSICGVTQASWWASVIRDSFQLIGVGIVGWALLAWRSIKRIIQSIFYNKLSTYCGNYYCYRWATNNKENPVEPNAIISRSWTGFFVLKWILPNTKNPTNIYNISKFGRKYIAQGIDATDNFPAQFVLHASYDSPPSIISGVYMFLNVRHEVVCGPFLMSRTKLTKEQVQMAMPFSVSTSSQAIADDRQFVLAKSAAKNLLTNSAGNVPG